MERFFQAHTSPTYAGTSTHDDVVPIPTHCALCAFAVLEPPVHDDAFSTYLQMVSLRCPGPLYVLPMNQLKSWYKPLEHPQPYKYT